MRAKPRALILCPENPYPVRGGGPTRTAGLVEYLSARYELDAIVFQEAAPSADSQQHWSARAHAVEFVRLRPHARHAAARLWRNFVRAVRGVPPLVDRFSGYESFLQAFLRGRAYNLAVVEHFWCSGYVPLLRERASRVVLDLHNLESVWHERCAQVTRGLLAWFHRRFARCAVKLEQQRLSEPSLILVTSPVEEALVRQRASGASTFVYPNTIPYYAPYDENRFHRIAFSGNLEYYPNIDAVCFFYKNVWPALVRRWPRLEWVLIGKNPGGVQAIVRGERIRFTGAVVDAVRELARAAIAVVPIRAGSGTRIKILEAWAAGTPVVTTPLGAEGLPLQHGIHGWLARSPAEFVEAVSFLLACPTRREALARAGRALYEQSFTWEAGWCKLEMAGI